MQKSTGEKIFDVINICVLSLLGICAIYPFIYVLSISLSSAAEASRGGLHLYPQEVSFTAYRMILANSEILYGYLNSILRTVGGTAATMLATCLCAYPLSRKELPRRGLWTFFIVFTMLLSGGIVPTYLVIKNLHLIDNRLVYILPMMVTGFNVIVVKNFFQQLPDSYIEAARIDGAGEFRILFHVIIPLSKPVLATVSLWTAVMHWNMWFDAMIYISSNGKQVMQTFLRRVVIESSVSMVEKGLVNPDTAQYTPETIKAATVIITILPIIAIYPFVQKYFVKGITLGGVKG